MNSLQKNVDKAVYKINTSSGSGTGFYLKDRGVIITNFHVVSGNKIVSIEDQKQDRYIADVIFVNPETDIAILKPHAQFDVPNIAFDETGELQSRDQVYVLGFPFGMPYTITEGIVSSTKQLMDDRYYIQTDAAVNPGNSGGPVINSRGELVGITTAKFTEADNVGFAIPVEVLKEELDSVAQNNESKYSVKCNSCKALIYEKSEYCSNCGNSINVRAFDDVELSQLANFVEEALGGIGANPVLARAGQEFWEYHQGSSLIRIFVFNNNYLYATSPLNELPTSNLQELYNYLLQDSVPPYKLGVMDNKIYVSYRVHLASVFSSQGEEVKKNLANLPLKADELDDFFAKEYACPFSNYAKNQD